MILEKWPRSTSEDVRDKCREQFAGEFRQEDIVIERTRLKAFLVEYATVRLSSDALRAHLSRFLSLCVSLCLSVSLCVSACLCVSPCLSPATVASCVAVGQCLSPVSCLCHQLPAEYVPLPVCAPPTSFVQ